MGAVGGGGALSKQNQNSLIIFCKFVDISHSENDK